MKKITLLLMAFLISGMALNAQKTLTEGVITLKIKEIQAPDMDDQQKMFMESMKNAMEIKIYFSKDEMMTKTLVMGGMMTSISKHGKDGKVAVYQEMMGQKYKINMTEGQLEEGAMEQLNTFDFANYGENVDVKKTTDVRSIAGYESNRMEIHDKVEDVTVNMWVSNKIKYNNPNNKGMEDLNTIPLAIEVNQEGMILKLEAASIEALPKGAMDIDDSIYQSISMEEYLQSMGQGMGGFGN